MEPTLSNIVPYDLILHHRLLMSILSLGVGFIDCLCPNPIVSSDTKSLVGCNSVNSNRILHRLEVLVIDDSVYSMTRSGQFALCSVLIRVGRWSSPIQGQAAISQSLVSLRSSVCCLLQVNLTDLLPNPIQFPNSLYQRPLSRG